MEKKHKEQSISYMSIFKVSRNVQVVKYSNKSGKAIQQ